MISSPKITLAIPYYINATYLDRVIRSVLNQSSDDWTCIVLDDSGLGSGGPIVASYDTPKISYFQNSKNLGLAAAWNQIIELSSTRFITLVHADDELGPNYVLNVLKTFERFPHADAVHCQAKLIDSSGLEIDSLRNRAKRFLKKHPKNNFTTLRGDEGLKSIVRADWIICPTMAYKRDIFRSLHFDESLNFAVDLKLFSDLLFAGSIIVGNENVDYAYRLHPQSQSTRMLQSGKRFDEEWRLLNEIGKRAKNMGWYQTERAARAKIVLRIHLFVEAFRTLRCSEVRSAGELMSFALFGPKE